MGPIDGQSKQKDCSSWGDTKPSKAKITALLKDSDKEIANDEESLKAHPFCVTHKTNDCPSNGILNAVIDSVNLNDQPPNIQPREFRNVNPSKPITRNGMTEDEGFNLEGNQPLVIKEIEDSYSGESKLRFAGHELEMSTDIAVLPTVKKKHHKKVHHNEVFQPMDHCHCCQCNPL